MTDLSPAALKALAALAPFPVLDFEDAVIVLGIWKHAATLTAADVLAVALVKSTGGAA